ncbi:unnamed protein product [Urochloa humidicola]
MQPAPHPGGASLLPPAQLWAPQRRSRRASSAPRPWGPTAAARSASRSSPRTSSSASTTCPRGTGTRLTSPSRSRCSTARSAALAAHVQPPAVEVAAGAPAIQVRLVNKLPAGSRSATPFLTFDTKGARAAIVQDVPISRPLSRSDIERLQAALHAAKDLPQDKAPVASV